MIQEEDYSPGFLYYIKMIWPAVFALPDTNGDVAVSKKSLLPQHRRHIFIYDEDWEWLSERYGADGLVSAAIRAIIHKYIQSRHEKVVEMNDE